ncbi:MAG: holo-ACP synthase [Anaerolineae bacterium]|nr:holo-ACP synthase [Anaerolineae bacterium]MCA9910966.1 holo-ACP synthase [Anaerolineae bacterium]
MLRCGIDMIEIERVEHGIARLGERFLNRFFTSSERTQCQDQPHRLAARLACKEAVSKAFGTGIGDISWREIEIICDARGRPSLQLHGKASALAAEIGLHTWDISLTHSRSCAAAIVVALGSNEMTDQKTSF